MAVNFKVGDIVKFEKILDAYEKVVSDMSRQLAEEIDKMILEDLLRMSGVDETFLNDEKFTTVEEKEETPDNVVKQYQYGIIVKIKEEWYCEVRVFGEKKIENIRFDELTKAKWINSP
jgi:hypothetical protein